MEYVPCHHTYSPCEADRIMTADKVGADRTGWMNQIHLGRQKETEQTCVVFLCTK